MDIGPKKGGLGSHSLKRGCHMHRWLATFLLQIYYFTRLTPGYMVLESHGTQVENVPY